MKVSFQFGFVKLVQFFFFFFFLRKMVLLAKYEGIYSEQMTGFSSRQCRELDMYSEISKLIYRDTL